MFPGSGMINDNSVSKMIRNGLNLTAPLMEINDAVAKFRNAILPWWSTLEFAFTSKGQQIKLQVQVDDSFWQINYAVSGLLSDTDTGFGTVIDNISINTQDTLEQNSMPVKMITQFQLAPVPWPLAIPARNNLTISMTNGQTVDANSCILTFWALRVPTELVGLLINNQNSQVSPA